MQAIATTPEAAARQAIEFEIEGHKILSDARESTTDLRAKATFQFLAEQELHHIEVIKDFAKALAAGEAWEGAELSPISQAEIGSQLRGIFERFKAQYEEVSELPDAHLEVYQVALEMERRGYDFYKAAAAKTEDPGAKKLFEFLSLEEERHFEIIQDTHDFLANPAGYLAWDERWMQT